MNKLAILLAVAVSSVASASPMASAMSVQGTPNFARSTIVTGGFATFFHQNGVAGACGAVHTDDQLIAAIAAARYGSLNQVSSLCGMKAQITNTDNQKTVTVTIVDACPTCVNSNSFDLSVGAFNLLGPGAGVGLLPIVWEFV